MIPVHVISLPRSTERRHTLKERLEALSVPFRFFDAIDGYALSESDRKRFDVRYDPHGHEQDAGVVGCFLSHMQLYRELAASGVEFACVLEDDAVLALGALPFLDEQTLRSLPRFDVLKLISGRGPRMLLTELHGVSIHAPYQPHWGSFAQIFSRDGLARIMRYAPPSAMGVDMMLYTRGLIPKLRVLEMTPPLATVTAESMEKSTIESHMPGFRREPPKGMAALRRKWFLALARFRVFRNFVRLWGFGALRRLGPD